MSLSSAPEYEKDRPGSWTNWGLVIGLLFCGATWIALSWLAVAR